MSYNKSFNYLSLLLGVVFIVMSIIYHLEEIRLNKNASTIEADVINWRIHKSRTATDSHEIQFRFTLLGKNETYTRADFLRRKDLWSILTPDEWYKTKETKKITIEYDPENPRNNRIKGKRSFSDHLTLFIVGISWIVLTLWLTFSTPKNNQRFR